MFKIFVSAKATCGHEIDPSEGRQLRKRPDPPKVEKKSPAPRKPYTVSKQIIFGYFYFIITVSTVLAKIAFVSFECRTSISCAKTEFATCSSVI